MAWISLLKVDRFTEIVISAGGQTAFPVTRHGQCRERYDRCGGDSRSAVRPDAPDDFQAIHARHLNIHYDHRRPQLLNPLQRLSAMPRQRHRVASSPQIICIGADNSLVIVDQQDQRLRLQIAGGRCVQQGRRRQGAGCQWCRCRPRAVLPGQTESKATSLPWGAAHADSAAVQVCHTLHQRQPQTGTGILPGQATVQLGEWLEQFGQIVRSDADAGIPDAEAHRCRCRVACHAQADPALFRREFDGIAKQIEQHLLQTARIGMQLDSCRIDGERYLAAVFYAPSL